MTTCKLESGSAPCLCQQFGSGIRGRREVKKEQNEEQEEAMNGEGRGCGRNDGQLTNSLFASIRALI